MLILLEGAVVELAKASVMSVAVEWLFLKSRRMWVRLILPLMFNRLQNKSGSLSCSSQDFLELTPFASHQIVNQFYSCEAPISRIDKYVSFQQCISRCKFHPSRLAFLCIPVDIHISAIDDLRDPCSGRCRTEKGAVFCRVCMLRAL